MQHAVFHTIAFLAFSCLAFSTPATWCRIFMSRNFMSRICSVPAGCSAANPPHAAAVGRRDRQTDGPHRTVSRYLASAVVATEFNQLTASSSASRRIVRPPSNVVKEGSSQHGPWSEGLNMSRLVTLSAPACTWKLCMCPGLCGNGSTVTTNHEVVQSLADVSWGLKPLLIWLLKLSASPLSSVS